MEWWVQLSWPEATNRAHLYRLLPLPLSLLFHHVLVCPVLTFVGPERCRLSFLVNISSGRGGGAVSHLQAPSPSSWLLAHTKHY